jgi:mannose-1-phosphate guanylyltransferase/phosphomannomutase
MKAVVMAGGEGSRLRPLTSRRPKPLVPVAGAPIMEHILTLLRDHDIFDVVVTLQYLGSEIRNHFGDGEDFGMSIEYVVEDQPLGTAGSVKNAQHLLMDDAFLVISGDALTDIDLSWVIAQHREKQSRATIVLYSVPNPLEYGVVVTESDGAVRRFLEKPSWGEVFSDQANTGIYVIEPGVFDYIKPDTACDWSQDVFPAMLRKGDPLYGVVAGGYWCDVGTIQSYLQANWDALEGKVRCHVAGTRHPNNVYIGNDVQFGIDVRIEGPAFIGDEAEIKAGAFINGPVVIDRYAVVDDNAKLSNSVLWPHAYIGESSRLRQSIVCRSVTIKNNCLLDENTVIGDECVIGQGAHIQANVKLWPNKDVQPGSSVHESIIWAGEWRSGLFSAYGLTGLINVELTPEFCARLGAAFAATLPKGVSIAVTRDAARASRMIKRALIGGITSGGGNVRDLSELPVPITQFDVHAESDVAAGIHVLSSPLDPRSADVRFYDAQGLQIDKRAERKIENLFFREDFRRVGFHEIGDIEYATPQRAYIEHVLATVDAEVIRSAGLRVLIDYDYSAASMVLPEILNQLNVTAVPLHTGFGELYRPKPPEQFRGALDEAALITRTLGADLGCTISTSGERLVLFDETGVVVDVHRLFGVLAVLSLDAERGAVLIPAAAPHWLGRVVEAAGGVPIETKNDPASVARVAVQEGVLLGSDGNGGFVWPQHLGGFDGMYTLVKLLELRARSQRLLSQVRESLPAGAYLSRSEFCPWEVKGRVMRVLLEQNRDGRLDLTDGIKIHVAGGFVLVLPDADAPYYRIIVSVDDPDSARALLDEYSARVRDAQLGEGERPAASVLEKA